MSTAWWIWFLGALAVIGLVKRLAEPYTVTDWIMSYAVSVYMMRAGGLGWWRASLYSVRVLGEEWAESRREERAEIRAARRRRREERTR